MARWILLMLFGGAVALPARLAAAQAVDPSLSAQTAALCDAPQGPTPPTRTWAQARVGALMAWADAFEIAERPQSSRTQLFACLNDATQKDILAAALHSRAGRFAEAESSCQRATEGGQPAWQGELWRCRAAAAAHQGQLGRSLTLLKTGLNRAPEASELYLALAQAHLANNDPKAAHHVLMQLLDVAGGAPPAQLQRARALVDEARAQAAPPLTPLDLAEQADLTRLMQAPSQDEDDLGHVRELAAQSDQPRLWPSCALILLRGPDPKLGRELLQRAEAALPLDADPSRLLAVYHLTATDYPGALAALVRAVRRQPFDAEAQVMLASVASKLGAWDIAYGAYQALTQLEPDRATHKEGLDKAQSQLRPPAAGAPARSRG